MTLKIERAAREGFTVFVVSGRIEADHIDELKELFEVQTAIGASLWTSKM
jgi:hypothetical protein